MARSRRDQLAAVAADLFRARGYAAVGVDDIAAAAGLTGPALYRHFPDKQSLLFEVLRGALDELWHATTAAGDNLDTLLPTVASTCLDQRGLAVLWRREGRHLAQAQQRELRARSNAILTAWSKVVLAARPGLAPADAELLCWAALSVFGSVMAHHMTVARQRFVALLAATATRVLHTSLPPFVGATRSASAPADPLSSGESALTQPGEPAPSEASALTQPGEPAPSEASALTQPGSPPRSVASALPRPGEPAPSEASALTQPGEPAPSEASALSGSGRSGALGLGTPSRREQVLAAATELFHRRGFQAVSMDDIGAASGIAGPSVYRHFPSKTAIFCAIARRSADRLAAGAEAALRASSTEHEALHRLVRSYVETITASAELTVALSSDTANLSEPDRAELIRVQRDYVSRWADLLAAARPELGPREARITVRAALAIANDLAATRRLAARPHFPAELAAMMTTALGV